MFMEKKKTMGLQREVGFLKEKRRMNGKPSLLVVQAMHGVRNHSLSVAMTRAKRHLVRYLRPVLTV